MKLRVHGRFTPGRGTAESLPGSFLLRGRTFKSAGPKCGRLRFSTTSMAQKRFRNASAAPLSTRPRPYVFVLMPFSADFDDIYRFGIKPACDEAGAYAERVDEQIFHESILQRVYNQIAKADLVVADMTGRNPNVFYEVGYSHALGKPTVLLTKSTDDIPFDLKHYPHIVYGGSISRLKDELQRRIRHLSADSTPVTTSESFIVQINDIQLPSPKPIEIAAVNGVNLSLKVAIQNVYLREVRALRCRVGVLTPRHFTRSFVGRYVDDRHAHTISTPNGETLHYAPAAMDIPPGGWDVFDITLVSERYLSKKSPIACKLKIFTDTGAVDYHFEVVIPSAW